MVWLVSDLWAGGSDGSGRSGRSGRSGFTNRAGGSDESGRTGFTDRACDSGRAGWARRTGRYRAGRASSSRSPSGAAPTCGSVPAVASALARSARRPVVARGPRGARRAVLAVRARWARWTGRTRFTTDHQFYAANQHGGRGGSTKHKKDITTGRHGILNLWAKGEVPPV